MHCELQAALATETLQAGSTLNLTHSAPKIYSFKDFGMYIYIIESQPLLIIHYMLDDNRSESSKENLYIFCKPIIFKTILRLSIEA